MKYSEHQQQVLDAMRQYSEEADDAAKRGHWLTYRERASSYLTLEKLVFGWQDVDPSDIPELVASPPQGDILSALRRGLHLTCIEIAAIF